MLLGVPVPRRARRVDAGRVQPGQHRGERNLHKPVDHAVQRVLGLPLPAHVRLGVAPQMERRVFDGRHMLSLLFTAEEHVRVVAPIHASDAVVHADKA